MTRRALLEYHAAHKFVLMAHSQQGLRRLGAMLGRAKEYPGTRQLADAYWRGVLRGHETNAHTP